MKMILIDAKYYGVALKTGRKNARLSIGQVAEVLRVSPKDVMRFEQGKQVPPIDVLFRLMTSGMFLLRARRMDK